MLDSTAKQIGIYVHIPFCEKKCFYCDFYSLENQSQRTEFVDALVKEIELFSDLNKGIAADTIFFGGGTPSLLAPDELERILAALHNAFKVQSDTEFTMECNPGAVDTRYLRQYRSLGANRLSFGVQSFFDDELMFLQRIHNAKEAVKAVESARHAGFDNINIDMIYSLPSQSNERVTENLRRAISLGTEHISAYSLIVEPGTPLSAAVRNGSVIPASETREAGQYDIVMDLLEEAGYLHYEISNYARKGFECRHNLRYWNAQEYAGFGPSAHSYIDGRRWWNVSSLSNYISEIEKGSLPVSASENLTRSQMLDEYVLLHMRQGLLDPAELNHRFGVSLDQEFVSGMISEGYCLIKSGKISLTRRGFSVCDEISQTLLARHSLPV